MPRRYRILAMITLAFLQFFTVAVGVTVVKLTPGDTVTPQVPAVASRITVGAPGGGAAVDGAAPMPAPDVLADRLTAVLRRPRAKINAVVIDAVTGRVLYDRAAGAPATPASTTKLVTSVAVLSTLGPAHRITTKVVQGEGDAVVLVGGGDPTLTARRAGPDDHPRYASLIELADRTAAALRAAGRTRVRVDYDSSLYRGERGAVGWKPNYLPDGEMAPPAALTVDEGRRRIGDHRRVADPPAAAATAFADLLDRDGLTARKGKAATAPAGDGTPGGAPAAGTAGAPGVRPSIGPGTELAAVRSPPASVLVEHLMTASDNDVAEAMARQVAIARGLPPTFAGGARAVRDTLAGLGVADGVTVHDGSGLSIENRITPMALARLVALAVSPRHPRLRAAITGMPVAAFSGTLAGRYTAGATAPGAGLVRAKTGTLNGVSTLAGTVQDADGRLLAFAFMANDVRPGTDAPGLLDRLAAVLARCGCR